MLFDKHLVQVLSDGVASDFLQKGIDPNESIAKIASQKKLNKKQIDRVVERANRNIIVGMQKTAVKKNPHFTFPTAKTAEVLGIIGKTKSTPRLPKRERDTRSLLNKSFPSMAKAAEFAEKTKIPSEEEYRKLAQDKTDRLIANRAQDMSFAKMASLKYDLINEITTQYAGNTPNCVIDSLPGEFPSVAEDIKFCIKTAHDRLAERGHRFNTNQINNFDIDQDSKVYQLCKSMERI